jgi:hypothetical protein
MNKIIYNFILILIIIITITSFKSNSISLPAISSHESGNILCGALKHPNRLLLDPKTGHALGVQCLLHPNEATPRLLATRTGCHYQVPLDWAKSIHFKNPEKGIMISGREGQKCPVLTYREFETLTFKGVLVKDGNKWKTLQNNRMKQLLRKSPKEALPHPVHLPPTSYKIKTYLFDPLKNTTVSLLEPISQQD